MLVLQERLLPALLVPIRGGPVVQVCWLPDGLLDEQAARLLQWQSDERVLVERHRQDGYRLPA